MLSIYSNRVKLLVEGNPDDPGSKDYQDFLTTKGCRRILMSRYFDSEPVDCRGIQGAFCDRCLRDRQRRLPGARLRVTLRLCPVHPQAPAKVQKLAQRQGLARLLVLKYPRQGLEMMENVQLLPWMGVDQKEREQSVVAGRNKVRPRVRWSASQNRWMNPQKTARGKEEAAMEKDNRVWTRGRTKVNRSTKVVMPLRGQQAMRSAAPQRRSGPG